MSKKKDSLKPWLSRPAINRSVTLPLTRPLTQRLSNLNEFHPNELDPYLLFDARDSMIGTLENPTLDLDPSKPDTLNVITATRSGTATYTDPDGLIASASADTVRVDYTQGAELTPTKFQRVGQTEFDQWTSENATITANVVDSPFGNQDASKLIATSTSQRQGITIVTSASDSLVASVYAKKGEYDVLQITDARNGSYFVNFDLTNGAVGSFGGVIGEIQNIGNGWFRCISKFTSSNDILRLRLSIAESSTQARLVNFAGNGTDGLYLYGPQLEEGTTATDFVENTTGSPKFIRSAVYSDRVPMILVELSSVNLIPYSEDFSNSDWDNNGSILENEAVSPDGTQNADLFYSTSTANGRRALEIKTIASGQYYTASVFAKAKNKDFIYFTDIDNQVNSVWFDIKSGTFSTPVEGEALIEDYGNGWFRCSLTTQSSGVNGHCYIGVSDSSGSTLFTTNGTDGVYLWGAQLETGSVATSYIPTSGGNAAARTRAADGLEITGGDFSSFFNGSEGTFYIEALHTRTLVDAAYISGQSSNQYFMYRNRSDNNLNSFDGGSAETVNNIPSDALFRAAVTYSTTNKTLSMNGTTASEGSINSNWAATNILNIGQGDDGQIGGHIKRLIYWPYHSDSL